MFPSRLSFSKEYSSKQPSQRGDSQRVTTSRKLSTSSSSQQDYASSSSRGGASDFRSKLSAMSEYSVARDRASSYSSRKTANSVRIVSNSTSEGGCVISAMATATGESYDRAREAAAKYGFDGQGMYLRDAIQTLSELGGEGEYHPWQPDTWSQFPDKAIVEVGGKGNNHAVVLRGDYIYDGNRSAPVHRDNYLITDKGSYIGLK